MEQQIAQSTQYTTPLKRILCERGTTASWLARQIGVSHALVGYWVRGEAEIPAHYQRPIVKALNSAPRIKRADLLQ